MCWLQRARLRRATGDTRLSYTQALEGGWVQLSLANTRPQERCRLPADGPALPGAHDTLAPVAAVTPQQLALFAPPPRTLAAAQRNAVADPVAAAWLAQELTGWAASRGWTRRRLSKARRGLHILLAVQDTSGSAVPMSLIDQLTGLSLPARLLHEFLAAHHFAEDDRTPAIDAWFARITAHLPEPMTGQLAHWLTVRLNGHAQRPRSRPHSPKTVRHQLHFALPVLTRLADAGTRDLADVTPAQLREHLAACRLAGTDHAHTASSLRAVFTTLAPTASLPRPAVHLRVGAPTPTIPLPADTAPIRQALTGPDAARAAITALLAFHALRASEIRHLTLNDARDLATDRLHLPARTIRLAEPVRVRLCWPHTSRTALSTVPVSRPWLYRQYPASSTLLRGDRIVDEAQAAGGDVRLICELFGLSIQAATRYTAAGNFPSV
ncbi:hypothetical protein [Streptomyces sp. NPDC058335]|uniref:hypothetical protein n=1 Tax=Streptomyces sp. NPDC058335 TaxID=3346451 RepID=UPI003657CD88